MLEGVGVNDGACPNSYSGEGVLVGRGVSINEEGAFVNIELNVGLVVGVGVLVAGGGVAPPLPPLSFLSLFLLLSLGLPFWQYFGFEHPRFPPCSSAGRCPVGSVYRNGLFNT